MIRAVDGRITDDKFSISNVRNAMCVPGYLPKDLYSLNTAYGSESELKLLIKTIKENNMKAMADIVINHRIRSTKGVRGIYNRYDGMPMPWDEHAVTCDTGGLRDVKEYRLWDPVGGKLLVSRDVSFNESRSSKESEIVNPATNEGHSSSPNTIEIYHEISHEGPQGVAPQMTGEAEEQEFALEEFHEEQQIAGEPAP
ncbi:hypothetical protein AXG93_4867s1000 [Marchantia polymorpha subsp. ruderalis]|uniref:1,4-alpha-D-glucan glucanohydrolase n=1 Tax=Marchantia polymorpha subsp. ruderalis TaxID=1480154 RepID=A0A176WRX2_MARPO|nr:hypothetical protein AXG93_4867s1000 [Marchantia polymorpha subsp. ruderalis]